MGYGPRKKEGRPRHVTLRRFIKMMCLLAQKPVCIEDLVAATGLCDASVRNYLRTIKDETLDTEYHRLERDKRRVGRGWRYFYYFR